MSDLDINVTKGPRTKEVIEEATRYHTQQIARANTLCRSGQWSPSEAANHRESHERLLRGVRQP